MNYGEAQGAESNDDFIHKCKISLKELKESYANLRIQDLSGLMPNTDADLKWLLQECGELVKIVFAIIQNAKRKRK